jgi:DNA-binding NarL/FixJ family response regulator
MPGMDGLAATRAIKADNKDVAVVMLTTFDLDEYVLEAIQSGASGFLLKAGDADELVRAIHVAAEGDALISPHALRRLLDAFMATPRPDSDAAARVARLTEREREVLALAAVGQSNTEIASSLVIGEATVKTHISSILRKLVARDRVHAVVIAYKAGLASEVAGP